ncbi:haloacid dehalogenase [Coniochaeta ligniaria NRRL 30616]|uniref:Haloacid dehalogenase n=1 Tax=Coniochaeta ligniaria NRRL 30616 TaxID=1408157 RepID=A0A1J7ILU2_9PEZI|nr:haloacid dehalogenase [Coniochaeta ligniaria NRRL 30616]
MAGPALSEIRGLTFDVFGTVVDWRTSIVNALTQAAERKLASAEFSSLAEQLQDRLRAVTDAKEWPTFAQEWRSSYGRFTKGFVPGQTAWKDIDTHHRDSLIELLQQYGLSGVFSADEIEELSKAWHFLAPWPDSAKGLHALGEKVVTATLSNGNRSLLNDLNEFGGLGFREIISAEDFKAYKPNKQTYLGAVQRLGLEPGQVAMVAAHLGDLRAARGCGLRTVYVERPREEDWQAGSQEYEDAKTWVDIWVKEDEEGFLDVARRMGILGPSE